MMKAYKSLERESVEKDVIIKRPKVIYLGRIIQRSMK